MNNQTNNKIVDKNKGKEHPTYEDLELNAKEIRQNLEAAALRAEERASARDRERESEIDYFEEMVSLAKKELVFCQLRFGIAPDENVKVQATISHYKAALAALREKLERENREPPYDPDYQGLKHKYNVYKAEDGRRAENCFVLRPDKDPAAVEALRAYAGATDNAQLAADIWGWVGRPEPPK